jgi:hypothetical protein
MEIEMKKARGFHTMTRAAIRRHAVNVVDAMLKDENALLAPSFFTQLDDVLREHGLRVRSDQFGIRGTVITIEPHEERDDGE